MQDRKLNLESRRTSRVNKLLPVRVRARDAKNDPKNEIKNDAKYDAKSGGEMLGAWTVVVNRHGARFESKRPFDGKGVVEVTVLATGRSATGNLIWANPRSNFRDNFEFAVELHEPANMWGITFPPEDWEDSEFLEKPERLQSVPKPLKAASARHGKDAVTVLDPVAKIGSAALPPEPLGLVASAARPADAAAIISSSINTENTLAISNNSQTGLTTVPPGGHLRADGPSGGRSAMTDRLTEVVRELIESAVRIEEDVASERLVGRVAAELEQARQAVFSGLEQQVAALTSSQTAQMEARAKDVDSRSQQILEENLRRIAEAGDHGIKTIREEAEASFSVIESLRKDIDQHVASLEAQFLDKCRVEADQLLSTSLETARVALSTSADEMGERMSQRSEKLLAETTGQMEQRSAKALSEIAGRMETQKADFFKNLESLSEKLALELKAKQQAAMQQVQSQFKTAADQSLAEMRSGLAKLLQGLIQTATSLDSPQVQ